MKRKNNKFLTGIYEGFLYADVLAVDKEYIKYAIQHDLIKF